MIKAFKSIVDTLGHYARPDVVRLWVSKDAPSQQPSVDMSMLLQNVAPARLAEAAERHGVDPARVEAAVTTMIAPAI
jgi:hypothetical protein